ncbi:MAG: thiamine pyrophosphate-dependent enzyme, partial [Pseudomonadota bacterium]
MTYSGNSSFLFSANDAYINEIYALYVENRAQVSSDWAAFFDTFRDAEMEANAYIAHADTNTVHGVKAGKASWSDDHTSVIGHKSDSGKSLSDNLSEASVSANPIDTLIERLQSHQQSSGFSGDFEQARMDSIRAIMLIRAYRTVGHMRACLDPLEIENRDYFPELDPANHGFGPNDYDRPIFINYYMGLKEATLREIIKTCEKAYCGKIGSEFTHIMDPQEKLWVQMRAENSEHAVNFTPEEQTEILQQLTSAQSFEDFLNKKFPGGKRFGLDGGESLVPVLQEILRYGANAGVEDINIGMAHRGRLNVLANVLKKPYRAIFAEFKGLASNTVEDSSGDVKYHLGTSADRSFGAHSVHLSLNPNPSHLEAINTVILGKVRAKMEQRGDEVGTSVVPILLHGDAAFIGQGIVAETFLLSQLDGYRVGGTIHITINNQIGFTTSPRHSRSSLYCTDMAKIIQAPVFHVNGDDPESCVKVARLAAAYRQTFHKDVVIDIICYRRHGHNESDQPMFTQPIMYKKIKSHPTTMALYGTYLEDNDFITKGTAAKILTQEEDLLEKEFALADSFRPNKNEWLEGSWRGISIA